MERKYATECDVHADNMYEEHVAVADETAASEVSKHAHHCSCSYLYART
jgi:hypothetical protein